MDQSYPIGFIYFMIFAILGQDLIPFFPDLCCPIPPKNPLDLCNLIGCCVELIYFSDAPGSFRLRRSYSVSVVLIFWVIIAFYFRWPNRLICLFTGSVFIYFKDGSFLDVWVDQRSAVCDAQVDLPDFWFCIRWERSPIIHPSWLTHVLQGWKNIAAAVCSALIICTSLNWIDIYIYVIS